MLQLTTRLRQDGLNIHVIAPGDNKTYDEYDNQLYHFNYFLRPWRKLSYGSGILSNLRKNPLLWLLVPAFIISMALKLVIVSRKYNPDIIHAHWLLPQGLVAVLTKPITRKPVIITAHGSDVFSLRTSLLDRLKSFSLKNCDGWTANTNATAIAAGTKETIAKPRIIPMGVDVEHFSSGNKERLGIDIDNRRIILFIGRLVQQKGVRYLLEAFSMLPDSVQRHSELWIIGDGDARNTLEELSCSLDIDNSVKFFGMLPNNKLPDYYNAADLFVGPSIVADTGDTEGQGVVFIEAFASRLCVIATYTGGIPEVIEDGVNGKLVAPADSKQLSAAMNSLLTDDDKRKSYADQAYETARNKYDWARITADFRKLYADTMSY